MEHVIIGIPHYQLKEKGMSITDGVEEMIDWYTKSNQLEGKIIMRPLVMHDVKGCLTVEFELEEIKWKV